MIFIIYFFHVILNIIAIYFVYKKIEYIENYNNSRVKPIQTLEYLHWKKLYYKIHVLNDIKNHKNVEVKPNNRLTKHCKSSFF